jgi:hypothetical protein
MLIKVPFYCDGKAPLKPGACVLAFASRATGGWTVARQQKRP